MVFLYSIRCTSTPHTRSFPTVRRTSRLPALSARHRTSFRNVIPLPATQGFSAEVPAGGRPGLVDRTTPRLCSAAVGLLFAQVTTGGIGKEITALFFEPALAEIMQLVGFALPDKDDGKPAAAFAASVAGAGCRDGLGGFHCSTSVCRNDKTSGRGYLWYGSPLIIRNARYTCSTRSSRAIG